MSYSETEALKQHLIANDTHFAELAHAHHDFDTRLTELAALHYPSAEEQMEEARLKKRKLQLKDEMEEILRKHKEQTRVAGH